MKFNPFKLQVPLAAGGISLMAFNYLQFAVPHGKGLIKLTDIPWDRLTTGQTLLYLPLIGIMAALILVNFVATIVLLKSFISWCFDKNEYEGWLNGPPTQGVGIFIPFASLSMTANVIFAPLGFFLPTVSSNIQSLMVPGLIFYGFLWVFVFKYEFKFLKIWLTKPLDSSKLTFVWLTDVFAIGLVNLTGTGIASMAHNKVVASIAAFSALVALSFGVFLLFAKLGYLIFLMLKSAELPQKPVQPAFFLMIPISCLYGISLDKLTTFAETYFKLDMNAVSFFLINFSYVIAIGWGIFTIYLISDYFKKFFYKSEFAAPQWAMV